MRNELPCPPLREGNVVLAATLVLVRDGTAGVEVYLTERPGRVDFPSLHVFPGGKVSGGDEAMAQAAIATTALDFDHEAADLLLGERGSVRYWLACLREAFEEVGVPLRPAGRQAA